MGELHRLINEKFGVETVANINPLVTTVGTSVTTVLGNNPNRLAFTITNLSVNLMYIGFEPDVSSSKGILVDKSGGSVSLIWDEDFEPTGYEIFALAAGASSAIHIVEVEAISSR